ncbi:MAG: patatin-like phospholipase family protein [Gemmatimonadetes bacterium]|nr:patatin-like phospholipase family protein [Gemmatimonadota bacterium]
MSPSRIWNPGPWGPRLWAITALLLFLSLLPRQSSAQHSLVLSGGGARGLSHAGAIVAIEELGYRPDLVVGTSMGAIVGALYAAGYSPVEIRAMIASENWLERFAPAPVLVGPGRDPRRPLLAFGISRGRFHGGFLPSTGINQRLVEMLFDAGVRARNDYDNLPIRYRAVTADLSTGAEFVIGGGDLPRAVRASMAVPGVFAPVQWDDRVLIDGGVANNLPVSVARTLSDRPVIAIDVLRPASNVQERGVLDMGVRALRLLIENARPAAEPDILVLPAIEPGFSETYFPADARALLRTGYDAVLEQAPPVQQQPAARRDPAPPPARIDGLRIEGGDVAFERLIRRVMGAAREYDAQDIVRRVSALYMTGLFQSVWPRVEFNDDGTTATLVIDVTPVASANIAGSARWNNDVGAGAWVSLQQRASLNTPVEFRLAGSIDELRHDAGIEASLFSAQVPGLRWNAGVHAGEQRLRVFDSDTVADLLNVRRLSVRGGGEVHRTLGDWYLSLFGSGDHIRGIDTPERWAFGPVLRITQSPDPDRAVGVDPLLEAELRAGGLEYQRARLRAGRTVAYQRRQAALFMELATSSPDTPLDLLPTAYPDVAPWLPRGAMRSRHQATIGLDGAIPTLLSGYVRLRLRAITAADAVDAMGAADAWRLGGELGAVWPTVLGPIAIGAAAGQRARWRFNISLGSDF